MPSTNSTITQEELVELRNETELWFTDLCDIYRISLVDDNYGGQTETETVLSSGIKCMLESGTAHEQMRAVYSKLVDVQLFTVTLPAETDIQVTDHIVVTSQNNLHLRVQAVLSPESWEVEKRVVGSQQGEHNA